MMGLPDDLWAYESCSHDGPFFREEGGGVICRTYWDCLGQQE